MTRDELLTDLFERKDLKTCIKNLSEGNKYYRQELRQELFLKLCELPEEQLLDMHDQGWLDYYIVNTMSNMFKSISSKFYYKIKRHYQNKSENIDSKGNDIIEELPSLEESNDKLIWLDEQERIIDQLEWYDRTILLKYLELGMITKTSRALNINTNYISESLKRSKEFIRISLEKFMNDLEDNKLY